MRRLPAIKCIVALLLLLSVTGCTNTAPSSLGTADASAGSAAASAQVIKDIVCITGVMKENLNDSFLLGSDGYPSNISVVFYSDSKAVFGGGRKVCLAKKDARGDWMYYVLDCNYFGSGDYRILGNKEGTYVAMSDYSNQILILNTETNMVSLLRFEAGNSVSFISWDSDVLYFTCEGADVPAYTYDTKTYSIDTVSQESGIPQIQNRNEYDDAGVLHEVFDIN